MILCLNSNSVAEIYGLESIVVHFATSMWNQIEASGVFSFGFNGRVSARMNFIPIFSLQSIFDSSIVDVMN